LLPCHKGACCRARPCQTRSARVVRSEPERRLRALRREDARVPTPTACCRRRAAAAARWHRQITAAALPGQAQPDGERSSSSSDGGAEHSGVPYGWARVRRSVPGMCWPPTPDARSGEHALAPRRHGTTCSGSRARAAETFGPRLRHPRSSSSFMRICAALPCGLFAFDAFSASTAHHMTSTGRGGRKQQQGQVQSA